MDSSDMKEIIGRKILSCSLSEEGGYLVFETDKGIIKYGTEGGCCSYSFFSDIEGLDNLLGEIVLDVTPREEWTPEEVKKAESKGDYESLALYGFLIKTQKGICDIEFRNDSNGYYGGWCYLAEDKTKHE